MQVLVVYTSVFFNDIILENNESNHCFCGSANEILSNFSSMVGAKLFMCLNKVTFTNKFHQNKTKN